MNEIYALDISTVFNHKTYLAYLPQAYRESVPYDTLLPMLPVLVTKFVRMEGDSVDLVFKANGRPLQLGGNASQFGTIKSDGVTLTTTAELVVLSLVKDLGITFDLSKLTRLGVEVICAEQSYYTERQITPALVDAYKQITYPVDPAQAVADLEPRFTQISAGVEEINKELDNAEEQLSETSPNLIKNRAVYNQYMDDDDIEDLYYKLTGKRHYEKYPFTIMANSSGYIKFLINDPNYEYSLDFGKTWYPLQKESGHYYSETYVISIEVAAGDCLSIRSKTVREKVAGYRFSSSTYSPIIVGQGYEVFGNLVSLLRPDYNNNQFPENCYSSSQIFSRCRFSGVVVAENLILPEIPTGHNNVPTEAFYEMFYPGSSSGNASELQSAPELKYDEIDFSTFNSMFRRCDHLNKVKCYASIYHNYINDWTFLPNTGFASTKTFFRKRNASIGNFIVPDIWTTQYIDD